MMAAHGFIFFHKENVTQSLQNVRMTECINSFKAFIFFLHFYIAEQV